MILSDGVLLQDDLPEKLLVIFSLYETRCIFRDDAMI